MNLRISVSAFAPAKLNLGLEVLWKRRDGYHEIETIFQTLDFGDRLEFHKAPDEKGLALSVPDSGLSAGPENTVSRAYALLASACPGRLGAVRATVHKQIPLGGGLGGGSSNGAAALLALDCLWRLNLRPEELAELALELGSDVPFFLNGGTALARGRGEKLQTLVPLSQGAFLLVLPDLSISTAWAYEHLRLGLTRNPYRISVEQVKVYLSRFPASGMVLKNRLEDVVFPAYPVFDDIREALLEAGAVHALMSGSGSTVYGTFPDRGTAEAAGRSLEERWRVRVAGPRIKGIGLD